MMVLKVGEALLAAPGNPRAAATFESLVGAFHTEVKQTSRVGHECKCACLLVPQRRAGRSKGHKRDAFVPFA
jgi:hypothetical protein